MIAQNDLCCANAQMLVAPAASQPGRHRFKVFKERLDENVKFLPCGCKLERPALEKRQTEVVLELNYLAAHRGLLNYVGHVTDSLADSAMPGHIVEELEMMDVHSAGFCLRWRAL